MQEENQQQMEESENPENRSMDILMKSYGEKNNSSNEPIQEDMSSDENMQEEETQQEEIPEDNNENYADEPEMYEEFMFEEF
ncbi:MAG: hypothetical protein ACPHY8_00990 [Patescibacteria group bacterium]